MPKAASAAAALTVLGLVTLGAARFGGWAVVSVDEAPDYVTVGKPTTFDFRVRQHGMNLLGGLRPLIEAQNGSARVEGRAWETPTEGVYRASIKVPSAGAWTFTIHGGFGKSRGQFVWQAVDSTMRVAALTEPVRGRQLFASKGCVTCHVHKAVDIRGEVGGAGPDLTDKRFAAQYLAQFLADPSIKPKSPDRGPMPNPTLRKAEIASLVAFINAPGQQVSSRP